MKTMRGLLSIGPMQPTTHVYQQATTFRDDRFGDFPPGVGKNVLYGRTLCGLKRRLERLGAPAHLGMGLWLGVTLGPPCLLCRRTLTTTLAKAAAALGEGVTVTLEG